jgi:bifunctional DNA-binding transcriptional regulator/antitoxin component of YhaV-PrlF toxin-antitoxin module
VGKSTAFITLDKKGRATLPEEVRQALGVGPGEFLLLERTERGTFEMVPANLVPNDQLWFHHPQMRRRLERAETSFREGKAARTSSPEEALRYLGGLKRRARRRH